MSRPSTIKTRAGAQSPTHAQFTQLRMRVRDSLFCTSQAYWYTAKCASFRCANCAKKVFDICKYFLLCFVLVFVNMDISERVRSVDPIWSVRISNLICLLEVNGAAETFLQVSVHTDTSASLSTHILSFSLYSFILSLFHQSFFFSHKILEHLNILFLE